MMDCQEFNDNIFSYCDGTLPSAMQAKCTLHLEKCANCRQNYNFTLLETELLQAGIGTPEPSPRLVGKVMESVASGTSEVPAESPLPLAKPGAQRLGNPRLWYGLAAAAVIIIAFMAYPSVRLLNQGIPLALKDNSAPETQTVQSAAGNDVQVAGRVPGSPTTSASSPNTLSTPSAAKNSQLGRVANSDSSNGELSNKTSNESTSQSVVTTPGPDAQPQPEDEQGRSPQASAAIAALQVSNFTVQGLPEGYALEAVDSRGTGHTIYYYANDAESLNFQLELVQAAPGSPAVGASGGGPLNVSSMVRVYRFTETTVYAYFSGNMSADKLRTISSALNVVRTQGSD